MDYDDISLDLRQSLLPGPGLTDHLLSRSDVGIASFGVRSWPLDRRLSIRITPHRLASIKRAGASSGKDLLLEHLK